MEHKKIEFNQPHFLKAKYFIEEEKQEESRMDELKQYQEQAREAR